MGSSPAVNLTKSTFHFKFNYSEIKYLQTEQFVTSPSFQALGHEWVIDCFPQGTHKDWRYRSITIMVRLLGECIDMNPRFRFSLMKKDGTKSTLDFQCMKKDHHALWCAVEKSSCRKKVFAYGEHPISLLKNKTLVNNGSLELICSVDNMDVPTMRCSLRVPKSFALHTQIGNLLKSSDSTDVTFCVENRSFNCHRLIMAARSPVFKAELFGNMAEATQQHIKIKDMCPEVFVAMLHFIYTDALTCCDSEETSMKMAEHLFVAADIYEIAGLKALCEDKLCASISFDTIGSTLALGEQHNCPRLKNACIEFIAKAELGTLISWMLTDEYVDLIRRVPSVLLDIRANVNTSTPNHLLGR